MTNPDNVGGSREAAMVVVKRDDAGVPTVWCDPEIVDLVTALNSGGVRTVWSCSGHGDQFGIIGLADGRQLMILPDLDAARRMMLKEAELCRAAPAGGDRVDGEMFICYLIDKCERETVTEESLHEWLADFLKNPRYHRPSAPAGSGEVERDNAETAHVPRAAYDGLLEAIDALDDYFAEDYVQNSDFDTRRTCCGAHYKYPHKTPHDPSCTVERVRSAAALLRKLQQGAGYVMVPREPTQAMRAAGERERLSHPGNINPLTTWDAMIAASQGQEGGHG